MKCTGKMSVPGKYSTNLRKKASKQIMYLPSYVAIYVIYNIISILVKSCERKQSNDISKGNQER